MCSLVEPRRYLVQGKTTKLHTVKVQGPQCSRMLICFYHTRLLAHVTLSENVMFVRKAESVKSCLQHLKLTLFCSEVRTLYYSSSNFFFFFFLLIDQCSYLSRTAWLLISFRNDPLNKRKFKKPICLSEHSCN